MDDASSGYSSGYFWGNNYWTGSMSLCNHIYKHDEDEVSLRKQSANTGLTFLNGNAHVHVKHENPPFMPRYSVLKVTLSEEDVTPNVCVKITQSFVCNNFIFPSQPASNGAHRALPTVLVRAGRHFLNRQFCKRL